MTHLVGQPRLIPHQLTLPWIQFCLLHHPHQGTKKYRLHHLLLPLPLLQKAVFLLLLLLHLLLLVQEVLLLLLPLLLVQAVLLLLLPLLLPHNQILVTPGCSQWREL